MTTDIRLPNPEYLPRRTVKESVARGRELRREVPHSRHGAWSPPEARHDPVAILEAQSAERMPELVPIRYGRMASSPFAFYRGSAAVMAADLAGTAVSGLHGQLCGDAHLMNFGLFATPERALIFGLNDFDETLPGPIEWDLKRLAASVEIAGRELGFPAAEREIAVLATVRAYREALLEFAEMRDLEVWYARLPAKQLEAKLSAAADAKTGKEARRNIRKALRRDHLSAFDRLVETVSGELRFVSQPPTLVPVEELLDPEQRSRYVETMQAALLQYREGLLPHLKALVERYRFVHAARKVVGVGSVGTRAWVTLFMGRDTSDPLLLQIKEATRSVLEPYSTPSTYESQGRRVVEGQRYMQAASDALLGWFTVVGWDGTERDYYVRQLWDGKSSIDISRVTPVGLRVYGEACGWTLARGHARSGDRIAMASYVGENETLDRAVATFAETYAHVNEADHARLLEAIDAGRIAAEPGV